MIPSPKRLTLSLLLLAGGTVAATVGSPPSLTAAATPTIIVSPVTSGTHAPGVQVVGFNFPPGKTVYLSRYNAPTQSYVALGTATVATTGLLTGTFSFHKALWCTEVTGIDNSGAYLLVSARTYSVVNSVVSYSDVDAFVLVGCTWNLVSPAGQGQDVLAR